MSSVYFKAAKKWQGLFHQMGWFDAILYTMNRVAGFFFSNITFNKYYFVAQLLNDRPMLPEDKGKKIKVLELISNEHAVHPCPRPEIVIQDRYSQGALCLAAYKEQEFAGCLWYVKNKYQEDEVRCQYQLLNDSAVWDFDVYVEPKFRLSPVFLKLWDEASARLRREQVEWSLSRISAFNPMSLSSHKRMGAKVLGWAVFVCIGSFQFTFSNISPFMHISFHRKTFPIFKFNVS